MCVFFFFHMLLIYEFVWAELTDLVLFLGLWLLMRATHTQYTKGSWSNTREPSTQISSDEQGGLVRHNVFCKHLSSTTGDLFLQMRMKLTNLLLDVPPYTAS